MTNFTDTGERIEDPDEYRPGTALDAEPANTVHMVCGPTTRWTTVNFAEAIQGVQTPLSWGIWGPGLELSLRGAFSRLGVFGAGEMRFPECTDDRMTGIFYGRPAGNVGFFRMVGERIPGSSADVLEEKLFGETSGTPLRGESGGLRRTGTIAVKFPPAAIRALRTTPALLADQRAWWMRNVFADPPRALEDAQRVVREGADRFTRVCTTHTIVSMIGPQLLNALTDLAAAATGDTSLGAQLATGFGGMEETRLIADLWSASQGHLDVAEIQRRHGFHGPDEGKLETRSWREDSAPIEALMQWYRKRQVTDPRQLELERSALRQTITARVLAGLPVWKRPQARIMLNLASRYILARELGKAAFLHALDGARCGARRTGQLLFESGWLRDPEDVFFLTLDELTGEPDTSFLDKTAERRDNHRRYLELSLPRVWNGMPTPVPVTEISADVNKPKQLQGLGVMGPSVTGRARVVTDPVGVEFEPGDILVCNVTDPSWTPLFMLADAVVIDTGGQMSHSAIVARELGICCVINTVSATRDIPDGATITVNGSTGVVDIHG